MAERSETMLEIARVAANQEEVLSKFRTMKSPALHETGPGSRCSPHEAARLDHDRFGPYQSEA